MTQLIKVQISVWCYRQARQFINELKQAELPVEDFDDHRDVREIKDLSCADEIDLMMKASLGPSIHFFFNVSADTAKEIKALAEKTTMWFMAAFEKNSKPMELAASVHIEDEI